jgi:diguanylate cyclase (GGDEF)-like protein
MDTSDRTEPVIYADRVATEDGAPPGASPASVAEAPRLDPSAALSVLVAAVQELSLARTAESVQRIVRTAARELTGADGATFVLRDGDKCFYVDEDAIQPLWKGQRFPLEACISGWTMLNHSHAVIEDIYADDRIPHDAYRPTFVKSLVMVPIRTKEPLGAIGLYWAQRHLATEEEIGLARALADSTAVALENVERIRQLARVRRLAETDPLTGLANRRAWDTVLEHSVGPSTGGPIHVLMLDLDHFKRFNDLFGHPAGDRLLVGCAEAWDAALRGDDLVARLGGEEFGVLLMGTSPDEAVAVADRMRRLVPRDETVSVGVATWTPGESAADLVARADTALYAAKKAGRDRVVVAS